jgi:hypothetical protein
LPDGVIAFDGYFVATTLRGTMGGVVAPLSPICMTLARALIEHDALQAEFPRCAVLGVRLTFDPQDPAQMAEVAEYGRQRDAELGGAQ